MLNIQKNKEIAGRPLFSTSEKSPLTSQSFMVENSLLSQLKPSKSKLKITRLFESILHMVTQFFKIERPHSLREKLPWIVRAGGSRAIAPTNVSFNQLYSHYQRFLKTDKQGSSQLKSCFDQMEKDESAILALNSGSVALHQNERMDSSATKKDPKVLELKQTNFVRKHVDDIMNMKEGHSRMFLLQRSPEEQLNGNLFGIVNKQGGKYSIRFIGTGALMRDIHTEKEGISLGGKEKVARELCFDQVPQQALLQGDWLKNLITSWSKNESITPKTILEKSAHLKAYQKEIKELDDLTTCSDRVDRLFWNVVGAFPKNVKNQTDKIKTNVENKRLRLRADTLTLFDFFQGIRYDLKPHTKDYQLLIQVFQGVSAKAHLAYQKGYLSQEELNQLNKELEVIEKTIQTLKKTSTSLPAKVSLKKEVLSDVSFKGLPIQPMQQTLVPLLQLGHRTDGQLPSNEPIFIPELTSIPLNLYGSIQTKEVFLQHFRDIFEKTTHSNPLEQKLARQEMSRLFNEVPYQPVIRNEDFKSIKNDQSFWWGFSKAEAQEIMEKINTFSQELGKIKNASSVTQYEFEAYLKFTQTVNLLNAQVTGYWIRSWDIDSFQLGYNHTYYWADRFLNNSSSFDDGVVMNTAEVYKQLFIPLLVTNENFETKKDNEKILTWTGQFRKPDNSIIALSNDEQKHVKTQLFFLRSLLNPEEINKNLYYISTNFTFFKNFFKKASWGKWKRPIQDPFLKALYIEAVSSPTLSGPDPLSPMTVNNMNSLKDKGVNTPEAFHDNPEGVFNFYLEENQLKTSSEEEKHVKQITNVGLNQPKESEKEKQNLSSTVKPIAFTQDEMKRLLRLVRHEAPQIELMAFMHECPHLMRNPEVRNFFDALFFHFLKIDSFKNQEFFKTLPLQIDQEIARLETLMIEPLKEEKILDLPLLQSRIDTLLYYHEMKEKIKSSYLIFKQPVDQFTPSKDKLTHLRQICQERIELQGSLAYATRIHLKVLLANQTEANIPEILKDYALLQFSGNDSNTDPYIAEELQRIWTVIAQKCETTKTDLGPFLDLLCYAKDLPCDKSEWKQIEGGIYRNACYSVHLKTLEVSKIEEAGTLGFLPSEISQHPHFQAILGNKNAPLRVRIQEIGSKKIYCLQDQAGHALQVEEDKGQLSFYKQVNKDQWLQILPENPFALGKEKDFKDFISSDKPGLKDLLKAFFAFQSNVEEKNSAFSIFSNYVIGVNPTQPSSFYCLTTEGKVAFQLQVKETKEGLQLEQATDYRTSPPSVWQMNSAIQLPHEALANLACFENKGKMVLWSQNNELKKIELPRYGLTFNYEKGQLICTDAALKGYTVDLAATLKEKKHLFHALVLQHPDPTKPKKLLVPEADAIVSKNKAVFPTGKGFAKIALFFEKLKSLIDMTKGKLLTIRSLA